MPKSDFNKVAKQITWVFLSCKLAAYFQNTFREVRLGRAASNLIVLIFLLTGKPIQWLTTVQLF